VIPPVQAREPFLAPHSEADFGMNAHDPHKDSSSAATPSSDPRCQSVASSL
jgi:hypothetical protein